ncbi:dioxygenase [Megasphaera cerevisiae DSM 20462]|jgi:D-methionine transport system substrate-binding protein|uniref:Lipoprotein n=1 Tax=Megasphaera cerevisiae DSM 20462 TaxID=1122219 RepID=A0A0J6WWP4_9FIRM|nr:MetQ/NlpA family ABC transporter substrate-binding protein [Megasphaera cerevisiae]KMO86257.1 dioxygenase [Megasphaera cerevisiae DSM 20462]OKY53048.1 metal ABC transporter substrate-binding protein [Megasphaera cerevisiae]SKA15761.1 D-methionine transport system substrate-binding protein [Megasphaera cerevisiae DSM 20462]
MKLKIIASIVLTLSIAASMLTGCGLQSRSAVQPEKKEITVGVTPGSSDQIMEIVTQEAAKQGLTVHVKTFSDYITPDQALANGDIDLNSFQHQPFLDAFNEKNGTQLISIGKTYLAPLALYSHTYKSAADIPDGAAIAIPNDPSNGGRALQLLQKQGWIQLAPDKSATKVTVQDIVANPKHLHIIELEAAQLPRSLDDTDAAVINAGYAISAGLNSKRDSIAVEDNTSPYVNIIAARPEDKDNPAYLKFVKAFQSDAVKQYINEHFAGELEPAW